MGLFDMFNKNKDYLRNNNERDAALILLDIIHGYKNGEPNYMDNGITKLSMGLYYLSFKRTNKKPFRLETAKDLNTVISNPKALEYVAVYKSIKQAIEKTCTNPLVIKNPISRNDAEMAILVILKDTAETLKQI